MQMEARVNQESCKKVKLSVLILQLDFSVREYVLKRAADEIMPDIYKIISNKDQRCNVLEELKNVSRSSGNCPVLRVSLNENSCLVV